MMTPRPDYTPDFARVARELRQVEDLLRGSPGHAFEDVARDVLRPDQDERPVWPNSTRWWIVGAWGLGLALGYLIGAGG